jgi:hypothetical protein
MKSQVMKMRVKMSSQVTRSLKKYSKKIPSKKTFNKSKLFFVILTNYIIQIKFDRPEMV